jgi:hypothetical protein
MGGGVGMRIGVFGRDSDGLGGGIEGFRRVSASANPTVVYAV